MVYYECVRCGYNTKHRGHLLNHLNRKNICNPSLDNISIEEIKIYYGFENESNMNPNTNNISTPNNSIPTPNNSILTPNEINISTPNNSISTPNNSISTPNNSKIPKNINNICKYCNKEYSRIDNLTRHLKICKNKKDKDKIIKMEKELEEFKKTQSINTQSINTQNNNITKNSHNTTNTININNYGDENLSFLKSKDFLALFNGVYTALPKLIEKIHFNPKHPENHNIKYTNKNYPYLKIMKEKKWQLVDKKYEILDLIDNKCFMFKENFDKILKKKKYNITDFQKTKIEEFLQKYHEEDKILMQNLFKSTELLLLNNS